MGDKKTNKTVRNYFNSTNPKSFEKTPNTVSFTNSSVPSKDLKQSGG